MITVTPPRWHLHDDGVTQIYEHEDLQRGWLNTPRRCPSCGHEWYAVAAEGASGIQCPVCLDCDPFYVWAAPAGAVDKRTHQ